MSVYVAVEGAGVQKLAAPEKIAVDRGEAGGGVGVDPAVVDRVDDLVDDLADYGDGQAVFVADLEQRSKVAVPLPVASVRYRLSRGLSAAVHWAEVVRGCEVQVLSVPECCMIPQGVRVANGDVERDSLQQGRACLTWTLTKLTEYVQRLARLDKLGGVVQVLQGGGLVAGGVGIEAVLEVDGTEPVRARAQEIGELIEYPAVRVAATVAGQSVEDNAAAPSVRGARPTRTRGQKSRSTRPPPLRW